MIISNKKALIALGLAMLLASGFVVFYLKGNKTNDNKEKQSIKTENKEEIKTDQESTPESTIDKPAEKNESRF